MAQRLGSIWQLQRVRLREHGAAETLAVDTWDEVAAEVMLRPTKCQSSTRYFALLGT